MIKEVDKFGNSNIYTKVYTKVEGVGDISRERVIHRQSVSQSIPTRTCDIYTRVYQSDIHQACTSDTSHWHSAAYAKHRVLNAGWYINPVG